jgi:hypothetical protein
VETLSECALSVVNELKVDLETEIKKRSSGATSTPPSTSQDNKDQKPLDTNLEEETRPLTDQERAIIENIMAKMFPDIELHPPEDLNVLSEGIEIYGENDPLVKEDSKGNLAAFLGIVNPFDPTQVLPIWPFDGTINKNGSLTDQGRVDANNAVFNIAGIDQSLNPGALFTPTPGLMLVNQGGMGLGLNLGTGYGDLFFDFVGDTLGEATITPDQIANATSPYSYFVELGAEWGKEVGQSEGFQDWDTLNGNREDFWERRTSTLLVDGISIPVEVAGIASGLAIATGGATLTGGSGGLLSCVGVPTMLVGLTLGLYSGIKLYDSTTHIVGAIFGNESMMEHDSLEKLFGEKWGTAIDIGASGANLSHGIRKIYSIKGLKNLFAYVKENGKEVMGYLLDIKSLADSAEEYNE